MIKRFRRSFGILIFASAWTQAAEIHVSPTGNDAAAGTSDAPLATLAAARDKADLAKAAGPVTIYLHAGTYYLSAPLLLGPANSGNASAAITYAAFGNDKPVISGGIKLPDTLTWKAGTGSIMVVNIGAGLKVDQLFLDGKRQIMCRYPNFDSTKQLQGYAADAIGATRAARWAKPEEGPGYVRALHVNLWGGLDYVITGKNADGTPALQYVNDNNQANTMHATYRMVENIFEELDAPGEWFYRKATGQLYFYPPAGTDLAKARLEMASQDELIRLVGDGQNRVTDITFKNLIFTHTYRTLFSGTYEVLLHSDWHIVRAGAVYMLNTERIRMQGCTFDQIGGNGIFMNGYNRNNVVSGNSFLDGGASCVNVIGLVSAVRCPNIKGSTAACTDRTPGPLTQDYGAKITIDNNLMARFGRFEKQCAAVNLGITEEDSVRHNTIHDCPRAGININTGCFGGHEIAHNWIYNSVLETSDHGPFNSWGRDRNLTFQDDTSATTLDAWKQTVIHDNRFETKAGNYGIDLDDQSSNYLQYNNLLFGGGLKMQWHRYNIYTNNILVGQAVVQMHGIWTGSQDVMTHNIFTSTTPYNIGFYATGANTPQSVRGSVKIIDSNCIAANGHITSSDGNYTFPQWTTAGLDVHSVFADAQFSDVNKQWTGYEPKGDYSVKAGSPCLAIGFKNFPMDSFGKLAASTDAVRDPRRQGSGGRTEGRFALRYAGGVLVISHAGDYLARITDLHGAVVALGESKTGADLRLVTQGIVPGMYLVWVRWQGRTESRLILLD
ncbi:MAG: right-handed parallel beta-helix repeat-containing protein [Fibrobacteres bacterium]|nr:right-handed parallel beta-helix repeat-containing protein [Fibrobacterota bacterium]